MTLFQFARQIAEEAELIAENSSDIVDVLPILRKLSLEDFGLLLISMPNSNFPNLSRILPRMASPDIQRHWTGSDGLELYAQTASFARQVETVFVQQVGRPLASSRILDFGVGYGRNLRSMLYFSDPKDLWGVDAWQGSLNLSIRDGVPGTLCKSEALGETLPINGTDFDLIFSFSVFTHISQEAAEAALRAMRKVIRTDGIAIITIRPVEYWKLIERRLKLDEVDRCIANHHQTGYAFRALPNSEDGTYGDASIELDFFNRDGWRLVGYDSSVVDRYQIAAVLKPC